MSTPAIKISYTAKDIYDLAVDGKAIPAEFVNVQNEYGQTALHLATEQEGVDAIHALLLAGAKPNATDNAGETPLHAAAREGNVDAVDALLAAGADPNAKNTFRQTPLHFAALNGYVGAIQTLLAAGADPNAKNNEGNTPLHCAAWYGHVAAIQTLLKGGAGLEEGRLPTAKARNKFQHHVRTELGAQEQSMLNKPLTWAHLNFNGFPQARIEEVEKCLKTLATSYEAHSEEKKALTSLSLGGLSLTPTAEAALACIIAKGRLTRLSLANTGCALTTDSLIGKALLENVTIVDLDISRDPITRAMLTAVKPLILRGKLEKLTLLDPALSVASLKALDEDCSKATTVPCLFLQANDPNLLKVMTSRLHYTTTWLMPDGSLLKPVPSLRSIIGSGLKTSLKCSFFAPPQAAVATAGTFNPSALLSSAQATSGDDGVGVGSPHQEDTSQLNGQTAGLVASQQAEQGHGMPVVPSTEEPPTPGCFERLMGSCFGRGYGRI